LTFCILALVFVLTPYQNYSLRHLLSQENDFPFQGILIMS